MEVDQAKAELRNYITDHFRVARNDPEFNDDVHLFDYGYVDSFGAVDLISFVETKFSIKIRMTDLNTYPLNTISQIAGFALQRQKGEL